MQRSNRTELCDATRNKKQSGFETHLGSDATIDKIKANRKLEFDLSKIITQDHK